MGYRTRQTVQKYETLKEMFKILIILLEILFIY